MLRAAALVAALQAACAVAPGGAQRQMQTEPQHAAGAYPQPAAAAHVAAEAHPQPAAAAQQAAEQPHPQPVVAQQPLVVAQPQVPAPQNSQPAAQQQQLPHRQSLADQHRGTLAGSASTSVSTSTSTSASTPGGEADGQGEGGLAEDGRPAFVPRGGRQGEGTPAKAAPAGGAGAAAEQEEAEPKGAPAVSNAKPEPAVAAAAEGAAAEGGAEAEEAEGAAPAPRVAARPPQGAVSRAAVSRAAAFVAAPGVPATEMSGQRAVRPWARQSAKKLRGAAQKGKPVAASPALAPCPRSLNLTTWVERVPSPPVVSWRAATTESIALHMGTRGWLQGQDESGAWFDIGIGSKNADGTYTGYVYESTSAKTGFTDGDYWPQIWTAYVRVKEETPAAQPFMQVTRSACQSFPARCASSLSATQIAAVDRPCARALPPSFWSGVAAAQTPSVSQQLLTWVQSREVCAAVPTDVLRRQICSSPLSEACVRGFTLGSLGALPPGCVARIDPAVFSSFTVEHVDALVRGAGARGLTPQQIKRIPDRACSGITADWEPITRLGIRGADLCAALPPSCFTRVGDNEPTTDGFPATCLPRLPAAAIRDLAYSNAEGKVGADAVRLCDLGESVVSMSLTAEQRAALPPVMCPACLVSWGGAERFPQCAGVSARWVPTAKMAVVPASFTAAERALVGLVCVAGMVFANVLANRGPIRIAATV